MMADTDFILVSNTGRVGYYVMVRKGATGQTRFGTFRTDKVDQAKTWKTRGGAQQFANRYRGMAGPSGWQVYTVAEWRQSPVNPEGVSR